MPNNLTDTVESQLINALHGVATFTAVTAPLKLRLMTALHASPEANAGTEVTGGTYTAQNMSMTTSTSGSSVSNTALIRFDGLPAATINAVEVYDNANTRRLWYAPLASPVTVTAGQPLEFAAGALTFALD